MHSSKQHSINGIFHIDELYIGGEEKGKRGRSKGDKKLVVFSLEIVEGGVGSSYAQCINNTSAASFRPFTETNISKDLIPNLEQLKSENGKLPIYPHPHYELERLATRDSP